MKICIRLIAEIAHTHSSEEIADDGVAMFDVDSLHIHNAEVIGSSFQRSVATGDVPVVPEGPLSDVKCSINHLYPVLLFEVALNMSLISIQSFHLGIPQIQRRMHTCLKGRIEGH